MVLKAIVTGATSGVGRAIAEDLLESGYRVVLIGRRAGHLAPLLESFPDTAVGLIADVGTPETAAQALILADLAPQDDVLLINAAGETGPIGPVGSVDLQWWADSVATNLLGPVYLTETFVPELMKVHSARIVNVSSAQAFHPPTALVAAYATEKVALNYYSRCVAQQLAGSQVAITAIHPGDVKTEIWDQIGAQAHRLGPEGASLRDVVARIESGGGDPLSKAVDLIRRIVELPADEVNGTFQFIKDGIQEPMPTGF